jgi:RNA polymerase sigma factor (TIGR02999 family)
MDGRGEKVFELLTRVRSGDDTAADQLLPLVYEDLRRLAEWHMARERSRGAGHTLQPTALVHEVYMRLIKGREVAWNDRKHFFAAAALAMRRILVDRARRVRNRPSHANPSPDDTPGPAIPADARYDAEPDWRHIDRALTALEAADPELAQIVHLRYFAGLTVEQAALALELSPRTVDRRWSVARAWLLDWMARNGPDDR